MHSTIMVIMGITRSKTRPFRSRPAWLSSISSDMAVPSSGWASAFFILPKSNCIAIIKITMTIVSRA